MAPGVELIGKGQEYEVAIGTISELIFVGANIKLEPLQILIDFDIINGVGFTTTVSWNSFPMQFPSAPEVGIIL